MEGMVKTFVYVDLEISTDIIRQSISFRIEKQKPGTYISVTIYPALALTPNEFTNFPDPIDMHLNGEKET